MTNTLYIETEDNNYECFDCGIVYSDEMEAENCCQDDCEILGCNEEESEEE